MFSAKKSLLFLAAFGVLFFLAAPAMADWDPGDGHKMHFPQLPDPQGWDVGWSSSWLGDDWQCSQTGLITDIHLWVSFKSCNEVPDYMNDAPFFVQIWSNDPGGDLSQHPYEYSSPKDLLYEKTFTPNLSGASAPNTYTIRHAGSGDQGWYWLGSGTVIPHDHTEYFQININDIKFGPDEEPWLQNEDEIYWLVTKFEGHDPQIGWKTADLNRYPPGYTGEHFMDDAVFYYDGWHEIFFADDADSLGISRDLAFVITPEPGTFVLLATAGLGLLLFAWRRRK